MLLKVLENCKTPKKWWIVFLDITVNHRSRFNVEHILEYPLNLNICTYMYSTLKI